MIAHILGLDNAAGFWYLFWSGIGSDLGELAIVGGLIQLARHHTCHVHRCWRVAKHPSGIFVVCAKHHPDIPSGHITADTVSGA